MEYIALLGGLYMVGYKYNQHVQQQSQYAPDTNKRFQVNDYIRDDIQNDMRLFHTDNVKAGDLRTYNVILGEYENAIGHTDEMREPVSSINAGDNFTPFGDANFTPDAILTAPAFYDWRCTNLTQYND
jgi:hypothetical protein